MHDIIRQLAEAGRTLPREAMHQALAAWEESAPPLLALLDSYAAGQDRSEDAADALFFILHLVGQAREKRAFPAICRLIADPAALERALGDGITESLTGILIGTYDGDLDRLKATIEKRAADEYGRASALDTLVWLTASGTVPLAETTAYLRHLHGMLRPAGSYVWYAWQQAIACLGIAELEPLVADAFRRGLIDPSIMDFAYFQKDLRAALACQDRLALLASQGIAPIGDVIQQLSRWHGFSGAAEEDGDADFDVSASNPYAPPKPAVNPFRDVGRNDPCPCGSGKKFKKCCLNEGSAL